MTSIPMSPSEPGDFHKAVGPSIEVVRNLAEAVLAVDARHGHLPGPTSKAMTERAEEPKFAGKTTWDAPVHDAHTMGGFTLTAAADYAHAFADLFAVGNRVPVYAHLVLARSVLETAVVSAWLNEEAVTTEERIKRGLAELLYSALELKRLDMKDADPATRIGLWKAVATGLGWPATKDKNGKPVVDSARRPSVPAGINELLRAGKEQELGGALWSFQSAVSHGTWYGLKSAVVEPPGKPDLAGRSLAGVGTGSRSVLTHAVCVSIALRRAAKIRHQLMGWDDAEWRAVDAATERYEARLIKGFGTKPPGR
jgi:hypothetical protein